jgi:hypothetical protein
VAANVSVQELSSLMQSAISGGMVFTTNAPLTNFVAYSPEPVVGAELVV